MQGPVRRLPPFHGGWYRPTATFLTPSAAYGLALNLAAVETPPRRRPLGHDRHRRSACRPAGIALGAVDRSRRPDALPAAPQLPGRGLGQGAEGRRPGEQVQHHHRPPRVPLRLDAYICLDGNPSLEGRVRAGLAAGAGSLRTIIRATACHSSATTTSASASCARSPIRSGLLVGAGRTRAPTGFQRSTG